MNLDFFQSFCPVKKVMILLDVIQPKNHATQQDFFKCEAGTIGKNHYFFPFSRSFSNRTEETTFILTSQYVDLVWALSDNSIGLNLFRISRISYVLAIQTVRKPQL